MTSKVRYSKLSPDDKKLVTRFEHILINSGASIFFCTTSFEWRLAEEAEFNSDLYLFCRGKKPRHVASFSRRELIAFSSEDFLSKLKYFEMKPPI